MDTKDRPVTDEELLDLLEGMSERDGELWQQVKEKGLTDDCLHLRLLAAASRIGQEEPDVEALLAAFHAGQSRKRRLRLRRWGLSLVGVAAAVLLLFLWMLPGGNGAGTGKEPLLVFASDSAALRSPVLQTEKAPGVQASADDGADRPAVWVAKGPHELDYHTPANLSAYAKDLPERHSLTVPRGQTFKLILSDGTEVYLNADSRLVYPSRFTGKERSVFLDGEAYFRVAKDAGHPFIVRTQTLQTRVLGTEFNVSGYEGSDTEVTLVEGSVEVSDAVCRAEGRCVTIHTLAGRLFLLRQCHPAGHYEGVGTLVQRVRGLLQCRSHGEPPALCGRPPAGFAACPHAAQPHEQVHHHSEGGRTRVRGVGGMRWMLNLT